MTNRDAAKQIRDAAKAWKASCPAGSKVKDLQLYTQDARDLNAVAHLIERGEREAAERAASNLDTLVRDLIPADAWMHLSGFNASTTCIAYRDATETALVITPDDEGVHLDANGRIYSMSPQDARELAAALTAAADTVEG